MGLSIPDGGWLDALSSLPWPSPTCSAIKCFVKVSKARRQESAGREGTTSYLLNKLWVTCHVFCRIRWLEDRGAGQRPLHPVH